MLDDIGYLLERGPMLGPFVALDRLVLGSGIVAERALRLLVAIVD